MLMNWQWVYNVKLGNSKYRQKSSSVRGQVKSNATWNRAIREPCRGEIQAEAEIKWRNELCSDLRKSVPSRGNCKGKCPVVGTCLGYYRESWVSKGKSLGVLGEARSCKGIVSFGFYCKYDQNYQRVLNRGETWSDLNFNKITLTSRLLCGCTESSPLFLTWISTDIVKELPAYISVYFGGIAVVRILGNCWLCAFSKYSPPKVWSLVSW